MLMEKKQVRACGPDLHLFGGAAGNRTRRKNPVDLRKYRETARESTRKDVGRPADTPKSVDDINNTQSR
jgi:hypothetical protein